jgi:hypothetical protein
MQLSDVLGKPVVDRAGRQLGVAHDVRLVRKNEYGQRDALHVEGVVIGPGGIGLRLGYGSSELAGPWILRLIFGTLARRARYAPWSAITVQERHLLLDTDIASLPHPREIEARHEH